MLIFERIGSLGKGRWALIGVLGTAVGALFDAVATIARMLKEMLPHHAWTASLALLACPAG